jgi:hypothetical protein
MPDTGRTLGGENVRVPSEHFNRQKSQPLADLLNKTAELERKLDDVRMSLQSELALPAEIRETSPDHIRIGCDCGLEHPSEQYGVGMGTFPCAAPGPADGYVEMDFTGQPHRSGDRTEVLVNHGRHTAYRRRISRALMVKVAAGTVIVAVLATIVAVLLPGGQASWPPSVARVQSEISLACQNPDVKSEPGQVNFACAKATRQVLWVFSLMTSANNPRFADIKTGRMGLEPIAPAQGGEVASSLNLHHPYDPANPIDSLEVAARAINDIVGGATLTGPNGSPVVQSGLESDPSNCVRYTGSAAVTSHHGFPGLCARPVSSPAGQATLVADVFQKWVVGAPPQAAQDAAVLFENARNPGDPRVRAILRRLTLSAPSP